jgi:hypothetical protein
MSSQNREDRMMPLLTVSSRTTCSLTMESRETAPRLCVARADRCSRIPSRFAAQGVIPRPQTSTASLSLSR